MVGVFTGSMVVRVINLSREEDCMKKRIIIPALFILGIFGCSKVESLENEDVVEWDKPVKAAGFSVPSLADEDQTIRLESYKGKVVLLDFWATWCPPCRHELPALNRMYHELKEDGFVLIGMTIDHGEWSAIAKAVSAFKLSYPMGWSGPEVQKSYGGIEAVPTKFLLDKKGFLRKRYLGLVPDVLLRSDIQTLLNEDD